MSEITLLNMDCMDYMREQPDKSFDLAIVDPPYFEGPNASGYYGAEYSKIGVQRAKHYDKSDHWEVPTEEYFIELKRVCKNQIIWGANHFSGKFNSSSPAWIIWDKDNGDSSFADAEIAYTSFNTAARIFKFRWNGMLQENMKNKEIRIHPTQKPIALYQWMLKNYAKPGQRILDTHGGSMSSAIAAHYFGIDFVCIEKDEDHYKAACERFDRETSQKDMFSV